LAIIQDNAVQKSQKGTLFCNSTILDGFANLMHQWEMEKLDTPWPADILQDLRHFGQDNADMRKARNKTNLMLKK
jgi:hypothetical protein